MPFLSVSLLERRGSSPPLVILSTLVELKRSRISLVAWPISSEWRDLARPAWWPLLSGTIVMRGRMG